MRFKTLILSGAILLGITLPAWSSRLKAVIIIQDDALHHPVSLYKDCLNADLGMVLDWLDFIDSHKVMDVDIKIIRNNKASLRTINNELRYSRAGTDDVWLLYFSGAGGMTNGDAFLYTADHKVLTLSAIRDMTRGNKARLKLIITDPKTHLSPRLERAWLLRPGEEFPLLSTRLFNYRNLLLEHKGTFFINSHSEGEWSWGGPQGSLFTQILFDNILSSFPLMQWSSVYEKSREWAYYRFSRLRYGDVLDLKVKTALLESGQNGQHPRVFSMPVYISNKQSFRLNNPKAVSTKSYELLLHNTTDQPFTLYWDQNQVNTQDLWTRDKVQTLKIPPYKTRKISHYSADFMLTTQEYQSSLFKLYTGNYELSLDHANKLRIQHSPIVITSSEYPLLATWRFHSLDYPVLKSSSFSYFRFSEDNLLELLDGEEKVLYRGKWWVTSTASGREVLELVFRGKYRKHKLWLDMRFYKYDGLILQELSKVTPDYKTKKGLIFLHKLKENNLDHDSINKPGALKIRNHNSITPTQSGYKGFRELEPYKVLTGFLLSFEQGLVGIRGIYRSVRKDNLPGFYSRGQYYGLRGNRDVIAELPGYRMDSLSLLSASKNGPVNAIRIQWKKWDLSVFGPDKQSVVYGNDTGGEWTTLELKDGINIGLLGWWGLNIQGLGIISLPESKKNTPR